MCAQVAIVMGSDSDWRVMEAAKGALDELGVASEVDVVSAHRTPQKMFDFARGAAERGVRVIIAGAGGAAHLPGMIASMTRLPVVGVPVPLERLDGLDSLLSIVQMPAGIPVATVSIGGARNAGILAARILGTTDAALAERLDAFASSLERQVDQRAEALRASVSADALRAEAQRPDAQPAGARHPDAQPAEALYPDAQRAEALHADAQPAEARHVDAQRPDAQRADALPANTQHQHTEADA